ncbi:MAG: hypothetical protein KIS92_07810 [Planctomycetota bacterium]|nr:hypothetical protein [Planctomycetota bacterium]
MANPSIAVDPAGEPRLGFEPFVSPLLLALLAAGAVLLAFRSYRKATRPLVAGRRIALWVLRALSAAVILLCLARPVWVQTHTLREKGLCFLALDASASMNLRDAPQNKTRWEYAGSLFASHQKELAELANQCEVRRILFDAVPRETQVLPGEDATSAARRPDGRATDLAALLDRVANEAGGTPCTGVLLIGDGRHNTPSDTLPPVRRLKAAGVPLYVVGVGQDAVPEDYREVQVKLLEVPEKTFIGAKLVIKIEIESLLPDGTKTPLTVMVDEEKVLEEEIVLGKGRQVLRKEVPYSPKELGMHRVTATVAPLPKEVNVNNNQRTAYFRVYQNKLGIWYVEGAIRKEFGAVRSALETSPNAQLRALNVFGPSADLAELLPEKEDAWGELRLVIIGDLPASRFPRRGLERLAKFVEDGGAVLMIGGLDNFGPGGWGLSPLAKVLPVEMSRKDDAFEGPLPLSATPEGLMHPVLKVADTADEARDAWEKLPPAPGINGVGELKPAAMTLLKAGYHPLLVVQEYGKGRSGVFTMDMTWQWILKAGQEDLHKRFWRNLSTWLTRSEYRDTNKAVFVESDRLQYMLGDEVQLRAHVQETDALKGAGEYRAVASLALEGGKPSTWELGKGPGEFPARRTPQIPGNYTYKVEVLGNDGKSLGSDELSFRLDVPDVENDMPQANLKLLQRLAGLSMGTYYDAEHGGEAFTQMLAKPKGYAKTVRETTELWNHWSFYAAFVLLLTLEWSLRKRWGLP